MTSTTTGRPAHLVLFDIDGTLIRTAGAGVRGLSDAIRRIHGWPDALRGVPVSGRTDRAILSEIFARWQTPLTEDHIAPLRDSYLRCLEQEMKAAPAQSLEVLPGVHDALDALDAHPDFELGLLTGNFQEGAAIKLGHFDLWRRFRFGAFGDVHVDRRDLVPVAIERARAAGIAARDVVVIGDTPLDVDCAHAHGARAVAVATGEYSLDALAGTGAEIVVNTLEALIPIASRLAALCADPRD